MATKSVLFKSNHQGHVGASLAIGVTTFNRLKCLEKCIEGILTHTNIPFDLIVADDGSTDGTAEWCAENGIPVIGSVNRGIAWNKNRALYALMKYSMAGVIVIIEDDCVPMAHWSELWVRGAERWGHINALHPQTSIELAKGITPTEVIGGTGTAEDPYICGKISGMCIASSRSALNRVGFLDSRFKGYGHEHAEWTMRFHKSGYGVSRQIIDGKKLNYNLMLGGVMPLDEPSASDKSAVAENRKLTDQLKAEQIYRLPWRDDFERNTLEEEIASGLGLEG